MPVAPGVRLGGYEVLELIGAGGMGEVYRARDTKLNRTSPSRCSGRSSPIDPDRLARFKREAQVLASLNHANIAQIYGLEDSGAVHALVMELVEGPTLADRVAQRSRSVDEALLNRDADRRRPRSRTSIRNHSPGFEARQHQSAP